MGFSQRCTTNRVKQGLEPTVVDWPGFEEVLMAVVAGLVLKQPENPKFHAAEATL